MKSSNNSVKFDINNDAGSEVQEKNELMYQYEILTSIINATPDIIFYKDYLTQDGKYIGCNNAFAKFVGKSIDEIIGHNDIELFGEEVGTFFRTKDKEMLLKNATVINEEWITYPDGTKVLVSTSKTPFYTKDGKLLGLVGLSHNITKSYEDTKNIEKQKQALEEQKELYELVFKNTSSGVFITDIETNKFIDCNEQSLRMLKADSKDAILNLYPADISPEFQPDGRTSAEKSFEMISQALKDGSNSFEWKHLRANGEEFWVEVILTLITMGGRKVLHAVWKDIDDKKRAEEDLKLKEMLLIQQSRLASMGEMIGNIAHQWRQPLNALSLVIGNIKDAFHFGRLDEATLQRSTDKAYRLINQMSSTIDDFRNFFSSDKEMQIFNPSEVIEEVLGIIDVPFKNQNIELIQNYKFDLKIEGYRNELSQVILNILSNAKDELLEKKIANPKIEISGNTQKEWVSIIIKDNAGGVPESVINKIFDPYFTTKEQGKGTGIGLYMSKMIIEDNMGGKLSVKNDAQGALFTIKLKISEDIEKVSPASSL